MLKLDMINKALDAMRKTARDKALKPLTIVMLDAGGQVRQVVSEDGAANNRFEVARGKANAALTAGAGSRALHVQAGDRPHFLGGLASVVPGGVVPVPGGVLARSAEGVVVAAFGVSGDTSDHDEAVAIAGIKAIGLDADAGE